MKTQNLLSQETGKVSSSEVFQQEMAFLAQGYTSIIGIDEAGRGPLAGPVVAAAAVWRNFKFPRLDSRKQPLVDARRAILNFESILNDKISNDDTKDFIKKVHLIKDSKKLSEKKREELFDFIQDNFYVGVGICDHKTIDRINILEATYLAMKSAVTELMRALPTHSPASPAASQPFLDYRRGGRCILLVDGNKEIPNLSIEQRAIVGGDKFVKSISAASIIAKVTRDRMMKEAHTKFPQYNFLQHKGYGTAVHMAALKKFGPCEIHRRSFRPVREVEEMYRTMISN